MDFSFRENGAPLRVIELFAGVGGFRLGLEEICDVSPGFEVVWSNQWEPSTRRQHASEIYTAWWGHEGHSNEDIFSVLADPLKYEAIADAAPDVLVGGFPCQDYSVAKPADKAAGLEGRKGVLWWAIHGVLRKQLEREQPVKYLVLENVDRLLKSPTTCRGRDFAIILSSLAQLGYAVEWRVVNAADYGFAQKRKRVFMVAYHRTTELFLRAAFAGEVAPCRWLSDDGVLPDAFPTASLPRMNASEFVVGLDPFETQLRYTSGAKGHSLFRNAGMMVNGKIWTADVTVACGLEFKRFVGNWRPWTLGDVVRGTGLDVPAEYLVDPATESRWRFLKGAKSLARTAANGHEYMYSEGAMPFPDPLDQPSRTIITSEGGSAPSRTKHVVRDHFDRLRRLIPDELEELNGFPRGFTNIAGISDTKRAFLMGNALVVGLVRRIGRSLVRVANDSPPRVEPANIEAWALRA